SGSRCTTATSPGSAERRRLRCRFQVEPASAARPSAPLAGLAGIYGFRMSELPQRVLVLGLARSGKAAAASLERRGVEVVGADRELGNDGDVALLAGVELLLKSPGVPRQAPQVA